MKKFRHYLFFMVLLALFAGCSSDSDSNNLSNDPNTTPFFDDFDSFNALVWNKETHEAGWTNNELQAYDTRHVSIGKDGDKTVLKITAERRGDHIFSGRVNTQLNRSFHYGHLEASIRLPKTDGGLWPAFWLMGDNGEEWPACGEIDIMEMGAQSGMSSGQSEQEVNTAIHYGPNRKALRSIEKKSIFTQSLQDGQYHIFALDRTPESLTVSIDGQIVHTLSMNTEDDYYSYFNHPFHLIFNLAVGGDFTGISSIDRITALNDGPKAVMYIDYVKIVPSRQ